ncbi:hypothetical protein pdam_00019158 [Pocillopora damicornis]|uniref:Uncharacterized protein n=1 Tax=Pocillopora damicornis TaxID=46731 RepID=A0A3M6TS94_POCDA|nr:hypothetical protein pdam_00019158 [Pocillopora damicornis]
MSQDKLCYLQTKTQLLTKESAVSRVKKSSSSFTVRIAKAEAIVAIVEPIKPRQGRIDASWDGFSETYVRRIHGPFERAFIPVSARGFGLFTQQDIGRLRKGLELYYK